MPLKLLSRISKRPIETPVVAPAEPKPDPRPPYQPAERTALEADELKRLLQLERYGTILSVRDQWRTHPEIKGVLQQASDAIDQNFCLVPDGCASLPQTINDGPGCGEIDVDTEAFLLARHTVTNAHFQKFVDGGGYDDLSLWPEDIWPHLIDYKDLTGMPGPRFWQHGRHNKALADHPVVGICYYEAAAYTQWAGFRLPTEAEWQVAATWRIRSSAYVLRRYPWGDALDRQRCNIWATGLANTTPVNDFESGAAPNGVRQLVGNVWEWTGSDFEVTDEEGRPIVGDMLMKSIRGGAYDTYFPSQATSCFRTGLATLVRAHNVGFRCALDLID